MIQKSFVSKIVKKGALPAYFITSKDLEDRECWFYFISNPQKVTILDSLKTGTFDLTDYGKIIASGFGKEPTPAELQKLKDEYGL